MKWLFIGGGVIAASIVFVIVVGALLPRDHVATLVASLKAPPETVWAVITDPAAFPSWRADVTRIEMLPPAPTGPSWREYSRHGAITMTADVSGKPRRLETHIADKNLPFGGWWEYSLKPNAGGGTEITITERGSVYNPVFRFVSRFIMGHTKSIDGYLGALGRKFGDV